MNQKVSKTYKSGSLTFQSLRVEEIVAMLPVFKKGYFNVGDEKHNIYSKVYTKN